MKSRLQYYRMDLSSGQYFFGFNSWLLELEASHLQNGCDTSLRATRAMLSFLTIDLSLSAIRQIFQGHLDLE